MAVSLLFSAAEALIRKIASHAVEKASSHAVEEASLALDVDRDLQQMKDNVALIKAVLLDAEQQKQKSSALSEWLRRIKHVFSDAENIVDDFECEALQNHVVDTHGSVSKKVRHFVSPSTPLAYRLKMAHEIKDIKERLDNVAADRHNFDLQIIEKDTRVVHVRETHSHVNPSDVLGREDDKQRIIELLLRDGHDTSLSVIPIVGFGGLGKTTLAKLVFNDTNIDECFPLKMWVCVSNDFDLKNVLVKILRSTTKDPADNVDFKDLDIEQLQKRLRNTLKREKFMLVLDDVWNEDPEEWLKLKEIIDVGVEGSKVLVTTRSHSIATMMQTNSSYSLKRLSEKDSFSLFVKLAFQKGEERKHQQLLEIGEEIVRKCGGIPLAVRTLGSFLFRKVDREEWEFVRDNAILNLPQNETHILRVLQFSYDQLPSYLKPCFACLSLFPEDFSIASFAVTVMWEALGFLPPPRPSETKSDVANRLLRELHSRSFLTDFDDLTSSCHFKLHDLVRDLAVFVAKGEFQLIDHRHPKISDHAQHLAFEENELLGQDLVPTGLRTIVFPFKATNVAFLDSLVSRCKYLRVLKIIGSQYESLPHSIGQFKHLRCLELWGNRKLKGLPDSVCDLQNLQTLNIGQCTGLQELPKGIRKLVSLRQLVVTTRQPNFPEQEIADLPSLENLEFYCCDNLESLFQEIQLSSLKSLLFSECGSLKSLPFHVIRNLESLVIVGCYELELLFGLDNQIPDSRLKLLILNGLPQLTTLPQWLRGSVNTLHTLLIIDYENLEELP